MKPKFRGPEHDDLLRPRLSDMIDMRHELVKLVLRPPVSISTPPATVLTAPEALNSEVRQQIG